jgi:hypothetical protein
VVVKLLLHELHTAVKHKWALTTLTHTDTSTCACIYYIQRQNPLTEPACTITYKGNSKYSRIVNENVCVKQSMCGRGGGDAEQPP